MLNIEGVTYSQALHALMCIAAAVRCWLSRSSTLAQVAGRGDCGRAAQHARRRGIGNDFGHLQQAFKSCELILLAWPDKESFSARHTAILHSCLSCIRLNAGSSRILLRHEVPSLQRLQTPSSSQSSTLHVICRMDVRASWVGPGVLVRTRLAAVLYKPVSEYLFTWSTCRQRTRLVCEHQEHHMHMTQSVRASAMHNTRKRNSSSVSAGCESDFAWWFRLHTQAKHLCRHMVAATRQLGSRTHLPGGGQRCAVAVVAREAQVHGGRAPARRACVLQDCAVPVHGGRSGVWQ